MKKLICLIICLALLFCFCSCGSDDSAPATDGQPAAQQPAATTETEESAEPDVSAEEDVDIDLTVMSSTMVYSEVYNMVMTPDDYLGKAVKMRGSYATYHDETTGNDYYACIIQDATACCTQGIEFVLADGNYPTELGMEIPVSGIFDYYTEGENGYCTLRDAKLC